MRDSWEWLALLLLILGIDIYYYRTQRRPTLSFLVKKINRDPVVKSILWAAWTWLGFHWFFEND